jgi:small GTP-binding protein
MSGVPRAEKPRLKIILVGDTGVGKTSLIAAFLRKPFDPSVISTVSPAYTFRDITRRDKLVVSLQIWDTAGQERYRSVSQLFYRDADVALVCFEAGSDESLKSVPEWVTEVRKEVPDCKFIFVGTKADLLPPGGSEKALAAAQRTLVAFQPPGLQITSAVSGDGVDELFLAAAELYTKNQQVRAQDWEKVPARVGSERPACC